MHRVRILPAAFDAFIRAHELLIAAGIPAPTARELAASCSLDHVVGWVAYAATVKGVPDPAGLIVARLKAGEPPPKP